MEGQKGGIRSTKIVLNRRRFACIDGAEAVKHDADYNIDVKKTLISRLKTLIKHVFMKKIYKSFMKTLLKN